MDENQFLKDFFSKKYSDNVPGSNFYIAFEKCGFHLSPEMFTDDISKQFSKNIFEEQISDTCDYIIPVGDTVAAHSLQTISSLIGQLIGEIRFNDKRSSSNLDDQLKEYGSVADQLKAKYKDLASSRNPAISFFPAYVSPDNFMDENSDAWNNYNDSWTFPGAGQPQNGGNSGQPGSPGLNWKIRTGLLQNFKAIISAQPPDPAPPPPAEISSSPAERRIFSTPVLTALRANVAEETAVAVAAPPAAVTATPLVSAPVRVMPEFALNMVKANPGIVNLASATDDGNHFTKTLLSPRFAGGNIALVRSVLNTNQQNDAPVTTNSLKISFQYCVASILRPWFDLDILGIADLWYCIGRDAGYYSTGATSEDNKGLLPSLSVSMILIKELLIEADFNAADWENAKKAIALASLNISEADFSDNGSSHHTISSKGVQIIGWICQYLPEFPVCKDPNS